MACLLIDDVIALMRPLAEQRHINLVPPLAGTASAYVRADLQRPNQVLLNLLSNAIQYNRDGGAVAAIFGVPAALVSLVDEERQWFKSCYGPSPFSRLDRNLAFYAEDNVHNHFDKYLRS